MRQTKLELPELNGDEEHTGNQLACEFYPDGAAMLVTRLGENTGFVMVHLTPSQVQTLGDVCLAHYQATKKPAPSTIDRLFTPIIKREDNNGDGSAKVPDN